MKIKQEFKNSIIILIVLDILLIVSTYFLKNNMFSLFMAMMVINFIASAIIAGIPTIIKKIQKKETYFFKSFLFGCITNSILLLFGFISRFSENNHFYLVITFLIPLLVLFHSIFYKKTGYFYYKTFKFLIEHIFNVTITSNKNTTIKDKIKTPSFLKNNIIPVLLKIKSFIKTKSVKIIKILFVKNKFLKPAAIILISVIAIISIGAFSMDTIKKIRYAVIKEVSPVGLTPNKAVIKVLYSASVDFVDPQNPGDVFKIDPPLNGITKIEGNTLIFIPDKDLPNATRFKVTVQSKFLKSKEKSVVEGKTFAFNTKLLYLNSSNFFFDYGAYGNEIKSVMGELEFSLPIDFDSLKDRIDVSHLGKKVKFNIEKSQRPEKLYIKIYDVQPQEKTTELLITVKNGIQALNGTIPMENNFTKNVIIKAKSYLAVDNLEIYPVSGTTYVAVKFNFPVDEKEVKNFITLEPAVDFQITGEYCYAIIQADFMVNKSYKIKIKQGLTAKNGIPMKYEYINSIFVRDLDPYVKFVSEGKILPKTDNLNIEFVSMNLDKVRVSVEKVYKNNLVSHLNNDNYSSRKHLWTKDIDIEGGQINEEVKNLINLKKLHDSPYEGLYIISLSDPKGYYNYSQMFVHITDMGLIIKNDGDNLMAHVVNIMDLNPMPQVSVYLISSENQILREIKTDKDGKVFIPNYTQTLETLTPFMIFAEAAHDFTYLPIYENEIDYSTFDVYGNDYKKERLDAFARTERGLYRPGENVYCTMIVRKTSLENPDPIPLLIEVYDPVGNLAFNTTQKIDDKGITGFTIPTKTSFKTGEYSIIIKQTQNDIIGSTSFKVEEFIPNTIETKIEFIGIVDKTIKFKIKSNELHGAPAKGLKVKTEIRFISRQFKSKEYQDYYFYNDDNKEFYQERIELGEDELDDNGEKYYEIEIPSSYFPPSALDAIIYTDVFDTSGRPVGAVYVAPVDRYNVYYGIKVEGKKPFIKNNDITVSYVSIKPDSSFIEAKDVNIKIERKVWYSIFKKYSWTKKYSSETYNEIIMEKRIDITRPESLSFKPDRGGEYRIKIGTDDGMNSTMSFFVYDSKDYINRNLTEPYMLTMKPDKQYYSPGETAYITLVAPFDGKCLVSIERDKSYDTFYVDISGGKALLTVPVKEYFIPNMYISALAFRPPVYDQMNLPPVSYGSLNIEMNKEKLAQKIEIKCNTKIKASESLKVDVYLPGGKSSKVVIACVDEGILQITNYKTPDPYDYFYRKRGLSVRTNTTLKDLLPDIAPYKKAFGGGEDGDVDRRHLNPIEAKRVKSLSLYSDIIECNADGKASYTFNIPRFNGKVRVMVMSANNKKFGSNQVNVTITDPIVISAGIPRFMGVNDTAELPVRVFNKTGADGKINIKLNLEGPLSVIGDTSYDVFVKNEGEEKILFKVKAKNDAGVGKIIFKASGNNESSIDETELAVRPPSQMESLVEHGVLHKGNEISLKLNNNYIRQGKFVRFAASPNKIIRYISALDYLIHYPYGCTEQITSSVFPLLYMAEYAKYSSVFGQNKYLIDKYINAGIKSLEANLMEDGNFAMWPGGSYYYPWVSDYVSHFLIEAKNNGYPVSDRIYDKILERMGITKTNEGRLDRRKHNIDTRNISPYHLYLKSIIGKTNTDELQYYYDILQNKKREKELNDITRCFLALSYSNSGDMKKAKEFLPENFEIKNFLRKYSDNFDSYVRNTAFYLYALATVDPLSKKIEKLEKELIKYLAKNGSFGNTQDTSWALMALSRANKNNENQLSAEIYVDGKLIKKAASQIILTKELNGEILKVKNTGNKDIYFNFISSGIPLNPDPKPVTNGLEVTKEYYNLDGTKLDIAGVKKGTLVAVSLNVKTKVKQKLENMILVDLLPAGFEIENTRIASRGDTSNIPQNDIDIGYSDIRDDRILIMVNNMGTSIRYTYIVRAVTTGDFIMPQFLCEAMYDPDIMGKTGGSEKLVIFDEENNN